MTTIETEIILIIVTVIFSFFSGYGLSLLHDWQKKRNKKKSSTLSIISYLKSMEKSLEEFPNAVVVNSNGKIQWHSIELDTSILDSIIYGGIFSEFEMETQTRISKLKAVLTQTQKLYNQLYEVIYLRSQSKENYDIWVRDVQDYGKHLDDKRQKTIKTVRLLIDYLTKKL